MASRDGDRRESLPGHDVQVIERCASTPEFTAGFDESACERTAVAFDETEIVESGETVPRDVPRGQFE